MDAYEKTMKALQESMCWDEIFEAIIHDEIAIIPVKSIVEEITCAAKDYDDAVTRVYDYTDTLASHIFVPWIPDNEEE